MDELAIRDCELTPDDLVELQDAVVKLEHVRLAMRLANSLGKRIEGLVDSLPQDVQDLILKATSKAMRGCVALAMKTLDPSAKHAPLNRTHKAVCTVSGFLGGLFGIAPLVLELPFSTTVMLRSFAEIARHAGEDLSKTETKLNCLDVFALGAHTGPDASGRPHYFTERQNLSNLRTAAIRIGVQQASREFALYLDRIIARFLPNVMEKAAAQSQPILGALGGGGINFVFVDHYQDVAQGHFTIRRLERIYGPDCIRAQYEAEFRRFLARLGTPAD